MSKLLIVDDEPAILDMLIQACRFNGHVIESTNDPKTALAIYRTNTGDVVPFDLIVTDFNMPCWSGLTLALYIRNVDRIEDRHVPILCLTGNVIDAAKFNTRDGSPLDRIWLKSDFTIKEFERIIQEMIRCRKD